MSENNVGPFPVPGYPDLTWTSWSYGEETQYFCSIALHGEGTSLRRKSGLGARLEIVRTKRQLANISLPHHCNSIETIEEWLRAGGLKTRNFAATKGSTEEALALLADAAAVLCEERDDATAVRFKMYDRCLYDAAILTRHGEEKVSQPLYAGQILLHTGVTAHEYYRTPLTLERGALSLDVVPSQDGEHRKRLDAFLAERNLSLITGNTTMSWGRRSNKQLEVVTGKRGIYFFDEIDNDIEVLVPCRTLVPGHERIEFGEGLEIGGRICPSSRPSHKPGNCLKTRTANADAILGNTTEEQERAGAEAMRWMKAICAIAYYATGKKHKIDIENKDGKYSFCAMQGYSHRCDLTAALTPALDECIAKSGGFYPATCGEFHDGAGHFSCWVGHGSIRIENDDDFLNSHQSGHKRLETIETAKGPAWFSPKARQSAAEALKYLRLLDPTWQAA